jgi:pyruvate dehydrogenase E2 component (dihydrolipoamide acetyltransferase)
MTDALFSARRGDGPATMALLHGFGSSHAAWNSLVPILSSLAQTIAYDLPGHGRSLDAAGAGQAKAAARLILEDLAADGFEKVHVVGHSMGGAVAVLMALAAPDRVASLTLLAPGGFGETINGRVLRRFAAARGARELEACLSTMSGPDTHTPELDLQPQLAMRAGAGQMEKLGQIVDMIARDDRQGVIPRERLAALTMPVTLLWGMEDPVLPFAQTSHAPPHFELRAVPRAGHMLIEEAPAAVIDAIESNLSRNP